MEKCLNLFKLDYNLVEISNRNGELSSHYPSLIVIPENEKQPPTTIPSTMNGCFSTLFNSTSSTSTSNSGGSGSTGPLPRTQQQTIYENSYDATKLKDLINKARFARSRTRFPIPVILYKGKYVCRSSTLSSGPEMYTRTSFNYLFNSTAPATNDADSIHDGLFVSSFFFLFIQLIAKNNKSGICFYLVLDNDAIEVQESFTDETAQDFENKSSNSDWPLFDQIRSQDIKLLKTLNVGTIVDFMVEKKKVKFGLK